MSDKLTISRDDAAIILGRFRLAHGQGQISKEAVALARRIAEAFPPLGDDFGVDGWEATY